MAIGPFTPTPHADQHSVSVLAEIGVAFLMFALGAEFSLAESRQLGRVASLGGGWQVLGTMALGPLVVPAFRLSFVQGVYLGALLALSSTVVALKMLMERGELQALHGRVALGTLIAQDMAVVPMVVVEYNPTLVHELRGQRVPVVYGDAGNPAVLEHAHVATARVLTVLMPDQGAAELATRHARAMAPRPHIVARARDAASLERLRRAGVATVVQPEFEAGAEVIQHALHRYGVTGPELALITTARRRAFYGPPGDDGSS